MAMQEDIFITKLQINSVRHLKDIEIPISETERKHLILTGKNGSGKTSVLEAIEFKLLDNLTKTTFSNLLDKGIDKSISLYLPEKSPRLYSLYEKGCFIVQ